jgi:uncharacterized protein (DUF2236 family)
MGLLSWPRALLLQVAHPLVAAGVAAHSDFRTSPLAPYGRLHATVRAMRHLTFGSDEQAGATLDGILRIHDRARGTLDSVVGTYPAGSPYSAHDPTLLLWVHATLLDSAARLHDEVVRPLSGGERDDYCREAAPLAEALGAHAADIPRGWATLQEYIRGEIASGRVVVGAQARVLARAIVRPSLAWLAWRLQQSLERLTVGSLPESIRMQYGFAWSAADERRRHQDVAILRRIRRRMPDRLARWPESLTLHFEL